MPESPPPPKLHPRIAFTHRDFRYFQCSRLLATIGNQMQSVAIGWHVYALTNKTLYLGLIGLSIFLPNMLFSLAAGHTADRFDRRRIVLICQGAQIAGALGLGLLTLHGITHIGWVYALLALIGTAQAFQAPSAQALLPLMVPPEHFSNAVAWNSSIWQLATIAGPCLGGWIYGLGHSETGHPQAVYLGNAALTLAAMLAMATVRARSGRMERKGVSWKTVLAGVRYVWEQKVILGCISLDLFAVLLGGAVALLPAIARDILHVKTLELGLMRTAPAVGALAIALAVAHLPPLRRAGATMLWCVGVFGLLTVVFGLSRSFTLSLACLTLMGAADMVSVIVRHTLVQVLTPREKLGRVSAVNMLFIGASNELGEFESGVTAAWWGTVPAIIIGGLGTVAVTALWTVFFPAMRRIRRLDQARGADARPDKTEEIDSMSAQ